MKYDADLMHKAIRLTEWVNLIVIGTGMFGVAAWYTHRPILFGITATVCTIVSVIFIGGAVFTGTTEKGAGYVPICILFFVVGVLLAEKFWQGIILGGCFFGLYSMIPFALHSYKRAKILKAHEGLQEKKNSDRELVYSTMEEDDNREVRVLTMSKAYDHLSELVESLYNNVDELDSMVPDIEMLREYMYSGAWKRDFEADERGEIKKEANRSVLSEDGLFNLLEMLDEVYERIEDIQDQLEPEEFGIDDEQVSQKD